MLCQWEGLCPIFDIGVKILMSVGGVVSNLWCQWEELWPIKEVSRSCIHCWYQWNELHPLLVSVGRRRIPSCSSNGGPPCSNSNDLHPVHQDHHPDRVKALLPSLWLSAEHIFRLGKKWVLPGMVSRTRHQEVTHYPIPTTRPWDVRGSIALYYNS